MSKFAARIKEEAAALIPPLVFFFVALHLIALFRVLMLKGTGITLGASASATVAALVISKAVLLADLMPFINRYPDRPLVYNIAWKTMIYVLVSVLFHYLEHLVGHWWEAGDFVAANRKLLAEIVWPHFWAIQILLVVLILMYCSMRELVRAIGPRKVQRMFFGPLEKGQTA